jgi:hypothetical protein
MMQFHLSIFIGPHARGYKFRKLPLTKSATRLTFLDKQYGFMIISFKDKRTQQLWDGIPSDSIYGRSSCDSGSFGELALPVLA